MSRHDSAVPAIVGCAGFGMLALDALFAIYCLFHYGLFGAPLMEGDRIAALMAGTWFLALFVIALAAIAQTLLDRTEPPRED